MISTFVGQFYFFFLQLCIVQGNGKMPNTVYFLFEIVLDFQVG